MYNIYTNKKVEYKMSINFGTAIHDDKLRQRVEVLMYYNQEYIVKLLSSIFPDYIQ